jgi:hypothetical protein
MNTIQQSEVGESITLFLDQILAKKKAIIDEYESELSILESKKKEKLNDIESKIREIESKWKEVMKDYKPQNAGKPAKKKNKRMSDSEISESIKNIFSTNSSPLKTDELYEKIGIQRPRFDKYTKSPECVIISEKLGKAFLWSLK